MNPDPHPGPSPSDPAPPTIAPDTNSTIPHLEPPVWRQLSRAQWQIVALIVALTIASIAYRLLVQHELDQTALLFVGIPALLAIILVMAPPTRTLMGGVMRGLTLALLFSGLVLGEGFICILMAAPLFYLFALIVVTIIQWLRKRKGTALTCVALVLLPFSLEGTSPSLSFPRQEHVTASAIVPGTPADVRARLSNSPNLKVKLPFYLSLRFPSPRSADGSGLEAGSLRRVHFAGGHGMPGDLVMRVADSGPDFVRFETVDDMSKIAHWLTWQRTEVHWMAVDPSHTRVTWTFDYARRLDPAWYFGPWERYGVRKAGEFLIEANAGPEAPAVTP